jgi:hypothetical protein
MMIDSIFYTDNQYNIKASNSHQKVIKNINDDNFEGRLKNDDALMIE